MGYPVGQGVFAVLDDGFAGLVAVVGRSCLAGCDRGVVDEFEQMLTIAGDNGYFLAVLAQRIELVGICCLDLFACDV